MVKKGRNEKYIIFKGLTHRVKFSVIDNKYLIYKDKENMANKYTLNYPEYKVKFSVDILDIKYNSKTNYSVAGCCLYYGDNFWEAWRMVQKYIFNAHVPKEFEKYVQNSSL